LSLFFATLGESLEAVSTDTQKVKENDTCTSIIAEEQFTMTELLAWNPSIHRSCDNIGNLKGRGICVSPPGYDTYDVNVTVSWPTQTWATPTWGSWAAGDTAGAAWSTANATAVQRRAPSPMETTVYNATAEAELKKLRREKCPVTDEDLEMGFEWHMLSRECLRLLGPYCNPKIGVPVPEVPASGFPGECLPTAVLEL
jgi:hypothetical protein